MAADNAEYQITIDPEILQQWRDAAAQLHDAMAEFAKAFVSAVRDATAELEATRKALEEQQRIGRGKLFVPPELVPYTVGNDAESGLFAAVASASPYSITEVTPPPRLSEPTGLTDTYAEIRRADGTLTDRITVAENQANLDALGVDPGYDDYLSDGHGGIL